MTQKEAIARFKAAKVNVLSFEKATYGAPIYRRDSSYAGVNIVTALQEVARRSAEGKKVLILDPKKDDHMSYEIENKERVPYETCLEWTIGSDHPLLKMKI